MRPAWLRRILDLLPEIRASVEFDPDIAPPQRAINDMLAREVFKHASGRLVVERACSLERLRELYATRCYVLDRDELCEALEAAYNAGRGAGAGEIVLDEWVTLDPNFARRWPRLGLNPLIEPKPMRLREPASPKATKKSRGPDDIKCRKCKMRHARSGPCPQR